MSLIVLVFAFCYFIWPFKTYYQALVFKGDKYEKKKLNNGFEYFISIREPIYYKEKYTFLIHYKLCVAFFSIVACNLICAILFLILVFFYNIVLFIITAILSSLVFFSYFCLAIYLYIKKRNLFK